MDRNINIGVTGSENPEKKSLFHREPTTGPDTSLVLDNLSNMMRRLKVLEEREINLRRKTQVTDQNMLEHYKKISTELKLIASEMTEIKADVLDLKNKIRMLIKELQESAKKEDVQVIKKYLNLWQPMNFVTHDEIEKIVKEILEESNLINK